MTLAVDWTLNTNSLIHSLYFLNNPNMLICILDNYRDIHVPVMIADIDDMLILLYSNQQNKNSNYRMGLHL